MSESSDKESSSDESSNDGEEDEEEEGVWVEKKVQQEVAGAFVGPVPEIKVQAVSSMKE